MLFPTKLLLGEVVWMVSCTESGDLVHGERVRLKEPSALIFPGNVEEAAPARGGVILIDICHRHGNRDVGVNSFEGAGRALRRRRRQAYDGFYSRAFGKGVSPNGLHGAVDGDGLCRHAALKGLLLNLRKGFGKCDFRNPRVILEGARPSCSSSPLAESCCS